MFGKILRVVKSPLVGLLAKPLGKLAKKLFAKTIAKKVVHASLPDNSLKMLDPIYDWVEEAGADVSKYAHKYADKVGLGKVYETAVEPQIEALTINIDARFRAGLDRDD